MGTRDRVPDGEGGTLPPRLRAWADADHADRAGVDGQAVLSRAPATVSRMMTPGRCRRGSGWRFRTWPETGHPDRAGVDGATAGHPRWCAGR